MNIWRDMDADPPDNSYLGRQIIVSVIPRYGEPYTIAIPWTGKKGRVPSLWPIITHWMPMPEPYRKRKLNW